jgi:small subunit ribosomal protein S21
MPTKPRITIQVKGDINKALKIYKRAVINNGHILELRERQEYKKPTTIRREQKLKAIRKNKYNRDNIN